MKLKQTKNKYLKRKQKRKTLRYRRGGGQLDDIERQIEGADLPTLIQLKQQIQKFDIHENDETIAPLAIERTELRHTIGQMRKNEVIKNYFEVRNTIEQMLKNEVIKNYFQVVNRIDKLSEQITPRYAQTFERIKDLEKKLNDKIDAMSKR